MAHVESDPRADAAAHYRHYALKYGVSAISAAVQNRPDDARAYAIIAVNFARCYREVAS